jgi:hypothetical protein
MLPILVQHLPRDRERMGLRPVQMAGRLGLILTESLAPRRSLVKPRADLAELSWNHSRIAASTTAVRHGHTRSYGLDSTRSFHTCDATHEARAHAD